MTEVNIKTDPTSGRSRGFAFVAFGGRDSVDSVSVQIMKLKNCLFYVVLFLLDVKYISLI